MRHLLRRIAAGFAAWRFSRRTPARPADYSIGINLVGFARAEFGLGESLRSFAYACRQAGIPFLVRDVGASLATRQEDCAMLPWLEPRARLAVNLLCFNPDVAHRVPAWLRSAEWNGRYNIGVWYWELPIFPTAWRYALDLVDEIWVASEFVRDAVVKVTVKPVRLIPLAVEFDVPAPIDRSRWGLDAGRFVFLFSYDPNSHVARKNPAGVVAAFRQAFAAGDEPVLLVVKSLGGHRSAGLLRELNELAAGDPRIRIIDASLDRNEMLGLIDAADCYVSLHRSEGFGLGMAEAMYLGKPVIATGYSGNLAFMSSDNACLVDYRLTPVMPGEYLHGDGQVWAEPDLDQAAAAMARVARDPAYRERIGRQAARTLRARHSRAAMGASMAARLRELGLL